MQSTFRVYRKGLEPMEVVLQLPGDHNVLNALAAVAVATDEGVSDTAILRGLEQFRGVGRRFERLGEYPHKQGTAMLVDDYGHHPREVEVTIEALRKGWPERRLVMLFQPHRFTRTKDLYEDFVRILSRVNVLVMLD